MATVTVATWPFSSVSVIMPADVILAVMQPPSV